MKDFLPTLAVFMSTRFFTNHGEQTLFKKFQGVLGLTRPDVQAAIDSMRQFRACTIPHRP